MFFPILIPCFFTPSKGLSGTLSNVESGDKYTTEWWQNELDCYTIKQKIAAYLIMLERQGIVKKIKKREFDIVRFKPIKPFSKSDVIEKLKEKIL